MFNSFNEMMEEIFKKDKKISDLEAKLAESKETIKNNSHNKWLKAEAERYKNEYQSLKGYVDQLKQQLADALKDFNDIQKENDKLAQQLAEKDKAIESVQEMNQSLGQTCNNDAKEIERLREQLAETNELLKQKIGGNKIMDKPKKSPPNKNQCCGLHLGCYEFVEMKKKTKDLEAKLAESEKQIKDAREAGDMAVDSWCKNRRKYEAQIAEMQNKSFILYSMLYETLEKQGCEDIASQIDQMTGWTYDKEADWFKGNRNYDQLKQQLAEKEKKIESCNHTIYMNMLNQEMLQLKVANLEQSQNQKAIDELEKVKEYNRGLVYSSSLIDKFIDNQIKSLKGESK